MTRERCQNRKPLKSQEGYESRVTFVCDLPKIYIQIDVLKFNYFLAFRNRMRIYRRHSEKTYLIFCRVQI